MRIWVLVRRPARTRRVWRQKRQSPLRFSKPRSTAPRAWSSISLHHLTLIWMTSIPPLRWSMSRRIRMSTWSGAPPSTKPSTTRSVSLWSRPASTTTKILRCRPMGSGKSRQRFRRSSNRRKHRLWYPPMRTTTTSLTSCRFSTTSATKTEKRVLSGGDALFCSLDSNE